MATITAQRQLIFWGAVLVVFIGIVYLLREILLPFVLGAAIAYLLSPLINRMCGEGMSRRFAVVIILGVFFLIVGLIAAAVGPLLYREISDLIQNIPVYMERLTEFVRPASERLMEYIGNRKQVDVNAVLAEHAAPAATVAGQVALGIIAGGYALFHAVTVLVITPVVAYFMMKEWNKIVATAKGLIPLDRRQTVIGIMQRIDRKLSGFIRGQLSVMSVLGLVYAISLSIAGLQYGLLIGIIAGLLSVIPMIGSAIGLIAGLGVAFFQTDGDLTYMAIVAGIFVLGQLIEGNLLTPVLVGESIGLHPLWIFFALMAGASLFGILGMLLAVPVAAIISVLIEFSVGLYKGSVYYTGHNPKVSNG